MGRPLFYDTDTGDYMTLEGGKPRPLTDEEFLTVTMPDNRQGVTSGQRTVAMSLTNDAAAAELYLEQQGYFVKRYGQGWNFAVQKRQEGQTTPDPNGWSVVDPRGGLDAVKDILVDNAGFLGAGVLSDAGRFLGAAGGAVAGAGMGGIPGAIGGAALGSLAGAGAGGAGGEFLRQKLGQGLGVPQEIDDDQIIAAGIIGAAVPVVGPAAGRIALKGGRLIKQSVEKAARASGDAALTFLSRSSGLEQGGSLISGVEALLERASTTAHFPEIVSLLKIMRQRVGTTFQDMAPERKELAARLGQSKETFDLRPLLKKLSAVPEGATDADKNAIRKNYIEVVQNLRELLGAHAPTPTPQGTVTPDPLRAAIRQVPASAVNTVRKLAGNLGKFNDTSAMAGATKMSTSNAQAASGQLGSLLKDRLEPRVRELFDHISSQTRAAKDMRAKIGKFTETGRAVGLKAGSESALRNTFQTGASDFLDTVRRFDKWHGTNFEKPLRLAAIGERFGGPGGLPSKSIRPTVAGGVYGAGLLPGVLGPAPPGSLFGMINRAAGVVGLGTEAGAVGLTRFARGIPVTPLGKAGARIRIGAAKTGQAAGAVTDMAAAALATAPSRAAQVAAMQQAIREQMNQQPQPDFSRFMGEDEP